MLSIDSLSSYCLPKKNAMMFRKEEIVEKCFITENTIDIHHQLSFASDDIGRRCYLIQSSSSLRDKQYLFLKYRPISSNVIMNMNVFLSNRSPSKYIFHILQSFSHFLQTLIIVNEQALICVFHLHVGFYDIDNPNGFIHSFEHALQINYIHSLLYITQMLKNITHFNNKPFEVHVMHDLISSSLNEKLTNEMMTSIIDKYNNQKDECHTFLSFYLHWPKKKIILHIVHQWHHTWDCYSLSTLYLQYLANIIHSYNINSSFMIAFQQILMTNISIDPSKRNTLPRTLELYKELFIHHHHHWNFEITSFDKRDLHPLKLA